MRTLILCAALVSLLGATSLAAVPPDAVQKMRAARAQGSPKLDTPLSQTYAEFVRHRNSGGPGPFRPSNRLAPFVDRKGGMVVVDVTARAGTAALQRQLTRLGREHGSSFGRVVSGLLPISAIPAAEKLDGVLRLRMALNTTRKGLVTSQGDAAMRADLGRADFGVDGTGIRVGVLSDSFDAFGTQAVIDQTNGDLPLDIIVLEEGPIDDTLDEGRAMMQIIHDIAPGAGLAFNSAWYGTAGFANGILALASIGCQVIVDDVGYLEEPFLQDGILNYVVDLVAAAGISYHSAAGNLGRNSYEAPFRNSTAIGGLNVHDFDPGPGDVPFMQAVVPPQGVLAFVLEWADPNYSVSGPPGAATDLDVYLFNADFSQLLSFSIGANIGADPFEILIHINETEEAQLVHILVDRYDGPPPTLIKWIELGNPSYDGFFTHSSTAWGHPSARGAIGVGAAYYLETPAFGVNPPLIESYSSTGPMPFLFDVKGKRINQRRRQPLLVAPDGVETTFFYADADGNGIPNFFGTSAAAPHSAAVAALLWQANPAATRYQIQAALVASCIDMGPPGFDDASGYGLIQADAALAAISGPLAPGDLNLDGCVDRADLLELTHALQMQPIYDPALDLNSDGRVNSADARALVLLFSNPGGAPCE